MNTLFIIGNGFDLAHNLKTSYMDFIKWAVEKSIKEQNCQPSLFKIPSYYNYNNFIENVMNGKIEISTPGYTNLITKDILKDLTLNNWCDIEEKYYHFLSSINKDKTNKHYQSIKTLNENFELIKTELETYLTEQKTTVKLKNHEYLLEKQAHGCCLTSNFNYTTTLQDLYSGSIKGEIIHIHGRLNDRENPIIFGYAANDEESNLLLDKNDNEYLRNIKRFAYNRTNSEIKLKEFLNKNKNIYINILGHSIGISDKLILEQILNHKNIERIIIFYYENYSNYFNTQVNLQRIMRNNSNFSKLVNYQDSVRMPQHNDTNLQFDEMVVAVRKQIKYHKRSNNYGAGPYIL